jgi:hypothetical protein
MRDGRIKTDGAARRLRGYLDAAIALINDFDPNDQRFLAQPLREIAAAADGIERLSFKLGQLADLYEGCELAVVERISRICGAAVMREAPLTSAGSAFSAGYTVSYTIPRDMVVESWLLELLFERH